MCVFHLSDGDGERSNDMLSRLANLQDLLYWGNCIWSVRNIMLVLFLSSAHPPSRLSFSEQVASEGQLDCVQALGTCSYRRKACCALAAALPGTLRPPSSPSLSSTNNSIC